MVPLETPALAAMSSSRVLARPFLPKASSAASIIWPGRCSGRRFQRGVLALWGDLMAICLYITDWSVRIGEQLTTVKAIYGKLQLNRIRELRGIEAETTR